MKATRGILGLRRAPVLLAAMVGLAAAGSGCVIDGGSYAPVCTPDLTISWRILSASNVPITCAQAGNSDTLNAQIDGGGLAGVTDFPASCPPDATSGAFIAQLPTDGTYNVTLQLLAGGATQSETSVLQKFVDCSGYAATPQAQMKTAF